MLVEALDCDWMLSLWSSYSQEAVTEEDMIVGLLPKKDKKKENDNISCLLLCSYEACLSKNSDQFRKFRLLTSHVIKSRSKNTNNRKLKPINSTLIPV